MFPKAKGFPSHRGGKSFLLSRMESRRAYDLFPFISAPVKCGFRKALVVSMVSWATIFEISFFFICCPAAAFRQPVSIQLAGLQAGKVWRIGRMTWHILTFLDILILQRITICSRLYKEDI